MAKPILFSRTFPSGHPKAGQPTYFIEKIWSCLSGLPGLQRNLSKFNDEIILDLYPDLSIESLSSKSHTIRAGNRWVEKTLFSPRIWAGVPYRSKQIPFAPNLLVENVWTILILPSKEVFIQGQPYGFFGSPEINKLAYHDGLTPDEFEHWFAKLPFEGQIICWDPNIEY